MITTSKRNVESNTFVPTSNVQVTLAVWRYVFSQEEFEGSHSCPHCNFITHLSIYHRMFTTSRRLDASKAHGTTYKV
jgi:hypothetical protein